MPFLSSLAIKLHERRPDLWIWITASAVEGAGGVFVLQAPVGEEERVHDLKPKIQEILDARGGGPKGRMGGKANSLRGRREVLDLVRESIKGADQSGADGEGCGAGEGDH